ncbi:MAG: site-2 protease family protein [Alphaproteobacteria bacterium]
MDSIDPDLLLQVCIWLVPGITAIIFHEYAHGWMADGLGDPTARAAGRLSLNPVRHIDPVGTLLIPAILLLASVPFLFGWAKPVPVNFQNLKGGRMGVILVAVAGPLANLVMLCFWLVAALYIGGPGLENEDHPILLQMAIGGMAINLVLMVFNLIPFPPLDGGRILGAMLPRALARIYMKLEPFGLLVVLVLVATGAFERVMAPLLNSFFLFFFGDRL